VDIERAADLYVQGWTLRQIATLGRWQKVLADVLHSLAALKLARVLHAPGADADANAGDRN
jgi:hypothetical protein